MARNTKTNQAAPRTSKRKEPESNATSTKTKALAKKPRTTGGTKGKGSNKGVHDVVEDAGSGKEESDESTISVDWDKDNFNLTWKLITALTDNESVKNALFPPTGGNASTKMGSGKKKMEHHWTLAKELFTDHPDYSGAFAAALVPAAKKLQNAWKAKIKNRLACMVALVLKSRKEMGLTGEGIKHGSEITLERFPSEFVNKWAAIEEKCPYYFDLLVHIGERPNWTPVGLGNSADAIEDGVILGKGAGEGGDGDSESNGEGGDRESNEGGSETEADGKGAQEVRNSGSLEMTELKPAKEQSGKKTPARALTSNSATTPTPKPKTKAVKGAFDFEELARAEEITRQQELELEKAKVRAKADIKLQCEKNDFELRRIEMQYRQELLLEQLRIKAAASSTASGSQGHSMGDFNVLGGGLGFEIGDGGAGVEGGFIGGQGAFGGLPNGDINNNDQL